MQEYINMLEHVYKFGEEVGQRNASTREIFGLAQRYPDIQENFPLLTTKKMAVKQIVGELIAFIRGYDDVRLFRKLKCNVWDANSRSKYWKTNPNFARYSLGRIYGVQWRRWLTADQKPIDQLAQLVRSIKKDPHSRRHIVTAWNPGELDQVCLPPCHMFFQCNVNTRGQLNLLMYQRSADMFLGVPFNIASYSFLLLILAKLTGYEPGTFTHMVGSAHIYEQHISAVETQLSRPIIAGPKVSLIDRGQTTFSDFEVTDFVIEDYTPAEAISAPMIV